MRVLVTRPREDCDRTAEALARRGHIPVLAPLFEVRRLQATFPAKTDAVLAASANAVRMADAGLAEGLRRTPFLAVGTQTAAAGREAGFMDVRSADGDAAALARLVHGSIPKGALLLHLAGRPRRDEAITALAADYRIITAETYETRAAASLPEAVIDALSRRQLDAVLHFSARAATIFGDLAARAGLLTAAQAPLHVFISAAAADARFPHFRIAANPDLESVISAL